MTISSRTPEGSPHRCRICGAVAAVETSDPSGDTICPACGSLLWKLRDRFGDDAFAKLFDDPDLDSLGAVELTMELEELDLQLSEEERQRLTRLLRNRLDKDPPR